MHINEFNSQHSLHETVARIKTALPDIGFGILFELPFHEVLAKKGFPISQEAIMIEVCKPALARGVIDSDTGFAYFLPCKIVVRQERELIRAGVLSVREELVARGGDHVRAVAEQVEKALSDIVETACS